MPRSTIMRPKMMPGIALPPRSPKHSSRCGGSSAYLPVTRLAPQLAQTALSSGFLVPHLTHKAISFTFPIMACSQRLGLVIAAMTMSTPKMININGHALGRFGTNASSNENSPKRTRATPMKGRNHGLGTPKQSPSLSRRPRWSSGGGGTDRVGTISRPPTASPSFTALLPLQSLSNYARGFRN